MRLQSMLGGGFGVLAVPAFVTALAAGGAWEEMQCTGIPFSRVAQPKPASAGAGT